MKKLLLLLGALTLSATSFSDVTIKGPVTDMTAKFDLVIGGYGIGLGPGANVMTITGSSKVTAGGKIQIIPNSSLTIVNGAGVTVTTINGPALITINSALDANITPTSISSLITVQPSITGPGPTPGPTPVPAPTPAPGTSSSKTYMPRSKVDLDLAKNVTSSGFKSLENAKNDNGTDLDIQYIGGSRKYDDGSQIVKYDSKSNGVALIGSKNFGNFTIGGGFGYQNSKVKYKERFENTREKIDSYQFMLNGKYNFTENVDLSGVLTYSHNSHRYETPYGLGLHGAKFNSKIIDLQTRLGSRYGSETGYVKPFIGLGITSVKEGAIDKLNIGKASGTSGNATLGVYGQIALGSSVDLFGNIEYEHTFNKKGYHRERELSTGRKIEGLDYDDGLNLGLGLKYKFSNFNLTTGYELNQSKNSVFKVGFGSEF